MIVRSFTGTRHGMTSQQLEGLAGILEVERPEAFHHGNCLGADYEAHRLVRELFGNKIEIHLWLATLPKWQAPLPFDDSLVHPAKPPLQRDWDIARAGQRLYACPYTMNEVRGSGTWYTVNCARTLDRERLIILPDGIMQIEQKIKAQCRLAI